MFSSRHFFHILRELCLFKMKYEAKILQLMTAKNKIKTSGGGYSKIGNKKYLY